MRKSDNITIGGDRFRISLDERDIPRLFPLEKRVSEIPGSLQAGFDAYGEILLIALSCHHAKITKESLKKYSFVDLDSAVAQVLRFKMANLSAILGHGPLVGGN